MGSEVKDASFFYLDRIILAAVEKEVWLPTLSHKLICKSQFPLKSFNLSLFIANAKDKLTDLCGNRLMQKDLVSTFC